MATIGDRIRHARANGPARKVSRRALAEAVGIGYSTLADVENGYSNSTTALHRIAKRLKVRIEWLESGKLPMEEDVSSGMDSAWTDVLGVKQAAALGDGAVPDEYAETHKLKFRAESLAKKHLKPDRLAVIYGKGDSMYPTIKDGDAILVDLDDREPRDEKLFVITYGRDLFAKRLVKLGGKWFIDSDNKADPKWRRPVPVDETRGFEIHGRVRWIGSWED
jgi:phage repressor protein C with HTH and peptisase S24 domain